ncbi:hypothetical protein [Anoxybacillus flavithermus]|nr:hypothetical protein [Anoxybacillus flavithermus]
MPEKSGFFDSTVEDPREYTADEFAEYFRRVLTDGIFNGGTNLQVTADGTNMNVNIADGYAWIQGYMYKVYDGHTLTIDTADPTLNRIDRIVLRLDKSLEKRSIEAIVLKGTPSATPTPPVLTRNDNVYEISLAQVEVIAGKSFIEGFQVTDERLDTNVCGLVNSLIQADTTEIFNQFQAWYNSKTAEFQQDWDDWFATATTTFNANWSNWFTQTQNEWDTYFQSVQNEGFETPSGAQAKANQAETNAKAYADQKVSEHSADYVKHPAYAVASGSANTYTVTLNPAPTSYVEGMAIAVKINVDNTGPATINVNGLGAKAIKKPNGNDVAAGNLKAGSIYTLRYNGTNFILQGEGGEGTAQPQHVLSGQTFTNINGLQTGTMPNRTFAANGGNYISALSAKGDGGGGLCVEPQTGYYESGKNGLGFGSIYTYDPDFIPANIRQGVSIFGVTGVLIEGKRWASGTVSITNNNNVSVTGLAFNPKYVVCYISSFEEAAGNFNGKSSLFSNPPINGYRANSQIILQTGGFNIVYSQNVTIDWIAIE